MPTCRRKRVVLTEPSEVLLQLAKTDPNKEVYYMQQTGEIFETYEYDTLPTPHFMLETHWVRFWQSIRCPLVLLPAKTVSV